MGKAVFLTSDVGVCEKENGISVASKLNDIYGFVGNIKSYIKNGNLLLFIASNPNWHRVSLRYAELTFESFNLSGIPFKNFILLDNKNASKIEELVAQADLVFLAGGHTQTQMRFFEDIKLRDYLMDYEGVIVGQSAGALNLSEIVYCSPETDDELDEARYFKGLGLTKVNIEPHYGNKYRFDSGVLKENILLSDSKIRSFIAITDGSYIIDNGIDFTIHGEAYLFKNLVKTRIS